MKIEQFEDKPLAHYSYAILSECDKEIVLIDPARDPHPYYRYAEKHGAKITGIVETHPHADFVSSHLQIHNETGATIYASELLGADYPHQTFDDGQTITFGKITLKALSTPGHSPDSICILLTHEEKQKAVFTGDTLFIGDCGRPDLRENVGSLTAKREQLARQMYTSLRNKLSVLPNDVSVYPAHGAGTLCGKALSDANKSTIGAEKLTNWALQPMSENDFVKNLLEDQPFIPKYFGYNVDLNKKGAEHLDKALARVTMSQPLICEDCNGKLEKNIIVVDTRGQEAFRKGHLENSINLMDGNKFETWLGSIIAPGETFYLAADNEETLKQLIFRSSKIGYEKFIKMGFVLKKGPEKSAGFDVEAFRKNPDTFTIVDIRNASEVKENKIFKKSINIPLPELRNRISEIPTNKPIVVHCAGGYRSAAGSSILSRDIKALVAVYDLGEAVKTFI